MNKRAWLRIAEAFIGVMIILGVLIVIYSRSVSDNQRIEEVYHLEDVILDEIAFNDNLRGAVLAENFEIINNYVADRIKHTGFNFTIRICDVGDICGLPVYQKEVYARDRPISANLTVYNPKKVKIFMWLEK